MTPSVTEGDFFTAIVNTNEAQAKWDEATGRLGEALTPAANALRSFGADAIGYVAEMVENAIDSVIRLKDALSDFFSGGSNAKSASFTVDETDIALKQAEEYKTTQALATAGVSERQVTSADLDRTAANVVNGTNAGRAETGTPTAVRTTINIDGKAVAEAVTPAMRDINKSNPEVVSDTL